MVKQFILFIVMGLSLCVQAQVDSVCAGAVNKVYDVVANSGSTYTWGLKHGNTNGSIVLVAGRSDSITINYGATAGTDTLYVIETNSFGCVSDTVILVIVIKPSAQISMSGSDSICVGNASIGKLKINYSGILPFSCTYTDGQNVVTLNGINTNQYTINSEAYTNVGIKNYVITNVTQPSGCTPMISGSGSVTVFPKPNPGIIKHY